MCSQISAHSMNHDTAPAPAWHCEARRDPTWSKSVSNTWVSKFGPSWAIWLKKQKNKKTKKNTVWLTFSCSPCTASCFVVQFLLNTYQLMKGKTWGEKGNTVSEREVCCLHMFVFMTQTWCKHPTDENPNWNNTRITISSKGYPSFT